MIIEINDAKGSVTAGIIRFIPSLGPRNNWRGSPDLAYQERRYSTQGANSASSKSAGRMRAEMWQRARSCRWATGP